MSVFVTRLRAVRALAALLCAGLAATSARAATEVCVESTAALYQAFADIDGGDTDDITIKLRSGTYALGSDLHLDYRDNDGDPQGNYGRLTLSGGYNAGCSAQSAAPGATTLVGSGGQRTVDIELINNALTIDHISSTDVDWAFGNWICYQAQDRPLQLAFLRALDTRVSFNLMSCYDMSLRNVLLSARSDAPNDAVVSYSAYFATESPAAEFDVTTSTLRGGGLRLRFLPFDAGENPPSATVKLFGNVFENDGAEIVVDGGNVYASHNRYDSLSLNNGTLATDLDNITAAPQLQSNGVPLTTSPVVNAGTRFVPGGLPALDLAGNARQIGTDPDMGAFETAVDNSLYLDVTTTAATGAGSLAQAVASANATNGRQVIRFNLSGSCPRTLTLNQTLTLTDDVDIVGETQPGTQPNTFGLGYNGEPCIILKAGSGVGSGLVFDSAESSDDLKLSQIAFSGFSGSAVWLQSGKGHLLTGLQFGGAVGSTALLDVNTAIRIDGSAGEAQIGGPDAVQTNFIGGASLGIVLQGGGSNRVLGNAIGEAGLQNDPNAAGVLIYSPGNLIEDNWISRNTALNLLLSGSDAHANVLRDNIVTLGGGAGLNVAGGAHHNRVGPANFFGSNDGDGIYVASGSHNNLGGNRYSGNGGLAIDLGDNGVTPNDADPVLDSNITPNRNQNYPVLTSAIDPAQINYISLTGELSSTLGSYRIDVYSSPRCSASGHGEGSTLRGSYTVDLDCSIVTTSQQCTKSFVLLVSGDVDPGYVITTTATSPGAHTSEFSRCESLLTPDDRIFRDRFE